MKSFIRLIVLILLLAVAFGAWRFFGSDTNFSEDKKSFYIKDGSTFEDVINGLEQDSIIQNPQSFAWIAKRIHYNNSIHAGRYIIDNGSSIYHVLRLLNSGRQTAVDFVITKLRTKEDLAQRIGKYFECDSATFINLLNNNDSLSRYALDTNTVMTAIIPNTYDIYWNTNPNKIFKKLYGGRAKFWNNERRQKADALEFSPEQVYILASIIEEETNATQDKGNIASVYLNRLKIGMRLQADPTIVFALRDFTIKRVTKDYIDSAALSPYSTYANKGLPPGPICTPSPKTIDAVLNAPSTDYLYFVAKPDNSGLSNFASSSDEHQVNASNYHHYLNNLKIK
jgi:peptidoglycan lytic transglycosylase G